ncbi:MAG: ECF transporter S component [Oscillospiraceae bacterium]
MQKFDTKKLVGLALFTAIVVMLQLMGSFIRFGVFSISLVLVPIVVGAAIYGPIAGAWLGFVFGLVVLLSGDANFFLTYSIFGTILTVLLKGTAAGYCAGLVYRLFEKKNIYFAVVAAAVVCPIVNSGIFFLGCLAFFVKAIEDMGGGGHVVSFIVLTLIGGNFVFELLFNVVLSPATLRIINVGKKSIGKKA